MGNGDYSLKHHSVEVLLDINRVMIFQVRSNLIHILTASLLDLVNLGVDECAIPPAL